MPKAIYCPDCRKQLRAARSWPAIIEHCCRLVLATFRRVRRAVEDTRHVRGEMLVVTYAALLAAGVVLGGLYIFTRW